MMEPVVNEPHTSAGKQPVRRVKRPEQLVLATTPKKEEKEKKPVVNCDGFRSERPEGSISGSDILLFVSEIEKHISLKPEAAVQRR